MKKRILTGIIILTVLIIYYEAVHLIYYPFAQLKWTNVLIESIKKNDIEKVERQLNSPLAKLFSVDKSGGGPFPLIYILVETMAETPLYVSCNETNSKAVKLLFENGADPNELGFMSCPPIIMAIANGATEIDEVEKIVNLFIEYGADLDIIDESDGDAALIETSNMPVVDFKNDIGYYNEADAKAVLSIYKTIEENAKNKYPKTQFNNSILMYATSSCNIELINYLLSNTVADVNEKNNDGQTPLFFLMGRRSDEALTEKVALLLIENGADLTVRDTSGMSISDYARNQGEYHLAELIDQKIKGKN